MKYFAYCRKSSEGEERQALSIPAQIDEIKRVFGNASDIEITEWFEEKMSAKAPGRPIWSAMIKRIEKGEADGIVAWHPDRLARNSVDGGWIIHLLDRRILKDLKFVSYSYEQSPQGMFMLQIMFGQSKYYVDNLSVNVKRGLKKKIEMGWLPNLAPLGYRNDPGSSTIIIDSERFPLLRKAWELLLTDAYSVRQINSLLNSTWGFRTPVRKKSGGCQLSLGGTYRMFGNPFYAGVIAWHGTWLQGKHEPMVTLEEFNRAQAIFRRPVQTKPETHIFAYTGLIRCSCGLAVTAEEKIKPSGRRYVYYHCTRRASPRCNEPAIRCESIDEQIMACLLDMKMPKAVEQLLERIARDGATESRDLSERQHASTMDTLARTKRESHILTDLRVRELIGDDEYVERRAELQKRELTLQRSSSEGQGSGALVLELWDAVALLSKYAVDWFVNGTLEDKRLIFQSACSNPMLSGGILSIQARFPYEQSGKSVDCHYLRGIVETIGTDPSKEQDARMLIACVKCLKTRADARQSGNPVPPLALSPATQRTAPRGRASWREPRVPRRASAHDPTRHDRAV